MLVTQLVSYCPLVTGTMLTLLLVLVVAVEVELEGTANDLAALACRAFCDDSRSLRAFSAICRLLSTST